MKKISGHGCWKASKESWLLFILTWLAIALATPSAVAQVYNWRVALPAEISSVARDSMSEVFHSFDPGASRALRIESAKNLTSSSSALEQVKRGDIQLAVIPLGVMAVQTQGFEIFDTLFVFRDLAAVERYQRSNDGQALLRRVGHQGLVGLGYLHAGMSQIVSPKQLKVPRDLNGITLGTTASGDVREEQWGNFGVTTVKEADNNPVIVLKEGKVDAAEVRWSELVNASVAAWSVAETNHRYQGYVLVANRRAMEALPELLRKSFLNETSVAIRRQNTRVARAEARDRLLVQGRAHATTPLSMHDYDTLIGELKPFLEEHQPGSVGQVARAISASNAVLSQKYFPAVSRNIDFTPVNYAEMERLAADLGKTPTQSADVVYNAILSPTLPKNTAFPNRQAVKAGQASTMRFNIGPRDPASGIAKQSPVPQILSSRTDIALSVVMACSFCEPFQDSLKRVVYRPDVHKSDEVVFNFTPRRTAQGTPYTGTLLLLVSNDRTGQEQDRISVDVVIEPAETSPAGANLAPAMLATVNEPSPKADWEPDVVLYANEELERYVSFEIQPVSEEMKKLLGKLAFDKGGQRRRFRSGINDADMVDAMTRNAYGVMSAVSLQGEFLRRLSATGVDAVVSKASQQSLSLTDDESMAVTNTIAESGQRLYRNLFTQSADSDLRTMIQSLENAADLPRPKPLRLKVVTNRISLPWQYLHPIGPSIDAKKFWGMRFSISVSRASAGGSNRGKLKDDPAEYKVVFARYGSSADSSVPLALQQIKQLRQGSVQDLLVVDSGQKFLNSALSKERKQISAVVAFLHASSGAGGGTADLVGPQLEFNTGDLVTSEKLENLLNVLSEEEFDSGVPYLSRTPLVILNACETGPSTHLPHVKLQDALFQLGVQGVVVTEVSVWIPLGHEVGTRLIAKLGQGQSVSDALTEVRQELLREKKNPLGLLYVYYGDPAAKLRY